jgi:integrase
MGRRRQSNHQLPKRVYQRHGAYYFHPLGAKPIWLGRDLVTALAEYARRVDPPVQLATLGDVIDAFMRLRPVTVSPRTYSDNLTEARKLKYAFAHMRPEQIKPHHIYAYMANRGAPIRANREVALLSKVMGFAISRGLIDANPCKQVSRNTESPRKRYIEGHELRQFGKRYAPKWLRIYCLLKYLTGLRQGDMLTLVLQNIDDVARSFRVRTGKTGKPLRFKMTWALRLVLEQVRALRRPRESTLLFTNRMGKQMTARGFKSAWQRAQQKWAADGHSRFWEHDIRGKTGSDSATDAAAQELLGHDTPAQPDVITGAAREKLRRCVKKLFSAIQCLEYSTAEKTQSP